MPWLGDSEAVVERKSGTCLSYPVACILQLQPGIDLSWLPSVFCIGAVTVAVFSRAASVTACSAGFLPCMTHAVRSRAETCILVQALSMWERMWCHDRACVCTFDIASDVTPQVAGMRAHGKHVNFEIGNCNWHCTQLRSKGSEPYLISALCMPDADASLQAEPMFSTSYVSDVPGGWLLEVQHSTCQASAGLTWQSKAS